MITEKEWKSFYYLAHQYILLHIRSTLRQAVKQEKNNQEERLKQKRKRELTCNETKLSNDESSILTCNETQLSNDESSILTCNETQLSLQVSCLVSGSEKSEQNEDSNLLEKASSVTDKKSDSCSVSEDKNYINTLKEIIEQKLQNVPDLVCVIFLLSVYPLSLIRSATHLHNPYNVVVSMAAIFPMSLCLTDIRYALYLLMEMPVSIQKPSSFNKGLVKKIHGLYEKIGVNKGKALIVNLSYHLFVYALSQCLSCYWFFFRSLTYKGLTHADHIRTMSESFEDKFDQNFDFNISCRKYLR